jgi:hypothetical protein
LDYSLPQPAHRQTLCFSQGPWSGDGTKIREKPNPRLKKQSRTLDFMSHSAEISGIPAVMDGISNSWELDDEDKGPLRLNISLTKPL